MKELNLYSWTALILVLIGGINWGLVGLFNFNFVSMLFGMGWLGRLIYILVGIAAGYICYLLYVEKMKKS
ncbi:MAG: hypothetical protein A3F42_07780 [Gammaproteobacteria bacterium RIFCSPHIGHO2_12_FULL_37_34]|nr:MAG: hypothetical protein A3F42_07780 [Gammaproteobacteria bacterium RIFCSPHIGHO2_12_FULL_37_34]